MTAQFQFIFDSARAAGLKAVENAYVRPMVVTNEASGESWYVADGVCGFAWINVKPGTSKFARWLKKAGLARSDDYYGGVIISVRDFNQSMQKKETYAYAFAKVLEENGITATAISRID